MIGELFGETTGFSECSPKPVSKTIVITFDINGIAFSYFLEIKVECRQKAISVITTDIAKINT